ncbi:unnamed protein product [Cylicocyclus nassatus]|uniref:Uncharacterized protein n=1 Tax=Cylicocyclus nassatus TaxID=53992 RepID=A0AA36M9P4_CYLNA|nr:unnamed protein product [Cylicocyclus nassatus]
MSLLGFHKSQLTKLANVLRKKIAEAEQTNLESNAALTFNTGKDYEFVINRRRLLSNFISSIKCAASYLRTQRDEAEEFARQRPDEQGEHPLLLEIHAQWEASELTDLLEKADICLSVWIMRSNSFRMWMCFMRVAFRRLLPPKLSLTPRRPLLLLMLLNPNRAVDHYPLASDAGNPQQGDQRPRVPSGFGNPQSTRPPAPTSMHPLGFQTLSPNPTSDLPFASTSVPSLSTSYSLPSFEIPFFSGDMDAFPEFWNIFAASVHNNNSVPVAVKFMYLKTHLRGDAANIVANFQPTEENHEDAVRTIQSTYNRPEHLRMRLWDKLNKQATAKESAASQRATLGSIRAIWSQMKRLKEESLIGALNTIRSKFPRRTREKIGEMKNKEDQMWR